MKKQKMYIPVLEPGKSVSLICANKVTGLEEHLPTQEMLNIHMEQQKIMIQKDKDYKVHPLYLFVEKEEFDDLVRRIRGKNRNAETACIPLVCQYPAVLICVLCPKQEEEAKE